MSLTFYDEAMEKKFSQVFHNTIYGSPDEVFAESKDGTYHVSLPLITLYRLSETLPYDYLNRPEAIYGKTKFRDPQQATSYLMKAIPVELTYQVDLWASRRSIVDKLFEEIIFFLSEEPWIYVDIPGALEEMRFALRMMDVENMNDISSFTNTGRLYRKVLTYKTSSTRLFSLVGTQTKDSLEVVLEPWAKRVPEEKEISEVK